MAEITQVAMIASEASTAPSTGRRAANICLLLAVAGALVFGYRDALAAMVRLWDGTAMYSYGYMVPLVSVYLLWTRRSALAALTPRPAWALGSIAVCTALLLTIAARAGGAMVLEQLAFLLSLAGAALLLFGTAYVRVGWAALAYLLLMVPLWDGFTESLHEPFQQRSAGIGIWILHLLGIPAFREGTFITLPNLQIEVARVCSGVNYLVAVLALGLPLSYLVLRDNWRRAVLLIFAVAVAAASNGLRVALICVLAYYEVGSPLHGPFHVLHGLFVAGVGYVVLFIGLRLLVPRNRDASGETLIGRAILIDSAPSVSRPLSFRATLVLMLIFGLTGSSVAARASHPVAMNRSLTAFPDRLGQWAADPVSGVRRDPSSEWFPGADAELSRRYRRADGSVTDLYLAYYASQRQRKEMVTHLSEELHSRATQRRISSHGQSFDVNHAGADRNGVERLFWYELDAVPATGRYTVKARTIWNAVRHARSNGAVIVLSAKAGTGGGTDALDDVAARVRAALDVHFPR